MNDYPSNNNNNGGAGYEIEDLTSEQSPPSTLPSGKSYDAFLSFRGADTRTGFTDYLYYTLVSAGIRVYRDNEELRVGDKIDDLFKAMEESRISILIISPEYASSEWCLRELVQILKCRETSGQRVLPIFYRVEPSVVRHQKGSFGQAFEWYNKKYRSDRELVQEWRDALTEVSSLKGWESEKVADGHEGALVQLICQEVLRKLRRKQLHVADFPVTLKRHVNSIATMLERQPMVGLWGIGGIGKTTIAKAVYNFMGDSFDGICFLANVRERSSRLYGLEQLQENLLCDVLDSANSLPINYVDAGVNIIRDRLRQKKILVVVDDIDHRDQLMKLVGDYEWFGPASRVIITTRDKQLLDGHGVPVYEVTGLDDSHARKLFVWNAFRKTRPSEEFESCIHWLVDYAKGLPLALVVLGSFLRGRSLLSWQNAIEKLEKIPKEDINDVLKIKL